MGRSEFLEKNIKEITSSIRQALLVDREAKKTHFLQSLNPVVKIISFLLILAAVLLKGNIVSLLLIYVAVCIGAVVSRIDIMFFLSRVWVFIPLFTAVIALPALFLVPGKAIFVAGGFAVTKEGVMSAVLLVLRTATAVSLSTLFILTTPWPKLLFALKMLRIPHVAILLMSLCYRYIFVFINTLMNFLVARRSRIFHPVCWRENMWFSARTLGVLFIRSLKLADQLYLAMVSRGGIGSRDVQGFPFTNRDVIWIVSVSTFVGIIIWKG